MGEIADDIVEGACCQLCSTYFLEEHGYPIVCSDCWKDLSKKERSEYVKAQPDYEEDNNDNS